MSKYALSALVEAEYDPSSITWAVEVDGRTYAVDDGLFRAIVAPRQSMPAPVEDDAFPRYRNRNDGGIVELVHTSYDAFGQKRVMLLNAENHAYYLPIEDFERDYELTRAKALIGQSAPEFGTSFIETPPYTVLNMSDPSFWDQFAPAMFEAIDRYAHSRYGPGAGVGAGICAR